MGLCCEDVGEEVKILPKQFLELQAHWMQIRDEYDQIKNDRVSWHEPIHNGGWYVIGFKYQGKDLPEKSKAPLTTKLCEAIPGVYTFGFSIMKPNCEIIPHIGYSGDVLRVHLGLYTNPQASIKVDGEKYTWEDGQLFVFDDTKVHSAWNRGDKDRVILLVDYLKP